ncbi:hypothetical protein M9435_002058 [Picochlorum sp. BPE23]|nr:hypothetical protein M9435_002058 [Picochlorum sp. BPE23]
MDAFWKSALETAAKARDVAEMVSKRSKEFAESTAEEASKQFNAMSLQQKQDALAKKESQEDLVREMEDYGITKEYIESVKQLDFSAFRDYQQTRSHDTTLSDAPNQSRLNAWQERHAMLLVRSVKEIDELRFVLCPKYMDDGEFWDTYFQLMKDALPSMAFAWKEGMPLPKESSMGRKQQDSAPFDYLETQFRSLSRKASSAVVKAGESAGVDVSKFLPVDQTHLEDGVPTSDTEDLGDNELTSDSKVLEVDPDLEEYLEDIDSSAVQDDDDEHKEDSDLDEYLDELTKEDALDPPDQDDDHGDIQDDDLESLMKDIQ